MIGCDDCGAGGGDGGSALGRGAVGAAGGVPEWADCCWRQRVGDGCSVTATSDAVGVSSAAVSAASVPAQEAAVGTVVGMLRGWGPAAASASGDARRDGVRSDVR